MKIPEDFITQFTPKDFLQSCREAFRGYGNGTYKMDAREEIVDASGVFTLKMPAEMPGYKGEKYIREIPSSADGKLGSRTAVIRLRPEGAEEVEMDADYITNMRTGAGGALGVEYFAPDARVVSILGTGHIAKALALCVDALGVKRINAYSRTEENRQKFEDELKGKVSAEIILHDTLEKCIEKCDAILMAVPTAKPILLYEGVKCRYISCMGGDSRTAQLGEGLMKNAFIIPDNYEQCQKSGEFLMAAQGGYLDDIKFPRDSERILNIGDAANGRIEVPDDLIVCYFTGLAVQDIEAARMIYERWKGLS